MDGDVHAEMGGNAMLGKAPAHAFKGKRGVFGLREILPPYRDSDVPGQLSRKACAENGIKG